MLAQSESARPQLAHRFRSEALATTVVPAGQSLQFLLLPPSDEEVKGSCCFTSK